MRGSMGFKPPRVYVEEGLEAFFLKSGNVVARFPKVGLGRIRVSLGSLYPIVVNPCCMLVDHDMRVSFDTDYLWERHESSRILVGNEAVHATRQERNVKRLLFMNACAHADKHARIRIFAVQNEQTHTENTTLASPPYRCPRVSRQGDVYGSVRQFQ